MTCFETSNAAAPCAVCGTFDSPLHVVDSAAFYCKEHCPCCTQKAIDWQGEPKTIVGQQEGLF